MTGRLNAGLNHKLTLIAAPAGFGKTTLLSGWIPESPRCVTWLSLDAGDNDPARFWVYVIASLQQVHADLGANALAQLQSPQPLALNAIVASLINDISAFPDSVATVLEDYHVIDAQPVHAALAYFIDHLPHNLHLTITTRVDPPLPLARLRARDQLTELRANDLRFTPDEAAVFLGATMQLNLSAEEVTALDTRTEGWIAGLQIAALSMQGRDDVSGFVRAFSGSHRHIVGYLAEEVLNQRPHGTLSFLLQTSILSRLCASLCDRVTGGSDGQEILEKLEQTNLFITALDDERVWYRYHPLFAEVLQARLRRTSPELAPELHRRAAVWHADQGMMHEAVRHALAGGDFDEGARLIEDLAGDMLRRGAGTSLASWLDALPADVVLARPRLCLARAWAIYLGPSLDMEDVEEWAQLAMDHGRATGDPDAALMGEVAALQAMIASTRGESARSRDLAYQALANLPTDSPWRSAVTFCLATAHIAAGDIEAAAHAFDEAIELSTLDGTHYVQLAAAAFRADLLVLQGRLGRARTLYEQVLSWENPDLPQKGAVMAHAGLANILCEQNQLEAALFHIRAGAVLIDQVGGAWSEHVLARVSARVQMAQGDWATAQKTLERSYHNGQRNQVSLVISQAAALRAVLCLTHNDLEAANRWAAESGLHADDAEADHPGWRELEYLALARVLDVQGNQRDALALLDRLLQSAEIEGRNGSAIAVLVLQALLLAARGVQPAALAQLQRALALAEPEGYVRVFIDEGDAMQALLTAYRSRPRTPAGGDPPVQRQLEAYADRLLAAFDRPREPQTPSSSLIEPLSEREREILQLIAEGLSNQEIADQLVIAHSTVKSHINAIYGKLGTHRRTQALVAAREMGLLD
ncbi:MAG: LuxR C-terminal-related transcriptional regulator [Caldilineales bacterium]